MGRCVATNTIPPCFLCSAIMSSSNFTPSSSSATEGSSSNQIGRSIASNLASCSRFRWPIESILDLSFANLPSPISSRAGRDFPCLYSRSSKNSVFSRTVCLSLIASFRVSQLS
uniref:Uncharacterized protein MANES_14G111800 n=1 Tax=Rhizophora mucronata TaxID=61149 RepID=A0A2P2IRA9_RHIMU